MKSLPKKKNGLKLKILGYRNQPEDYLIEIPLGDVIAGLAEIQGRRNEQEDSLQVSLVPYFDTLSLPERKKILEMTFANLQAKHTHTTAGSTGNATIAWQNQNNLHVINANLGDSTSFVVILDAAGTLFRSQLLHTLHTPFNEQSRIEKAHGRVENLGIYGYRLNGILAVARGFGDADIGPGFSHEPDITEVTFNVLPGQQSFLITACDGLTEMNVLDAERIGKIVALNHTKPAYYMAHELIKQAYTKSQDNISVAVIPISTQPVSAAIFDGHNGKEVAKDIGELFYPTLFHNIIKLK